MNKSNKGTFGLTLSMLIGFIIGGVLGSITENVKYLSWINIGKLVGFNTPFVLDLDIINLQFSLSIRFTIGGILGIIIAIIIYKKF